MTDRPYDAVILDLDGVITHTASLHARAWKRMFDEFLERRSQEEEKTYEPFDIDSDYRGYVDGKPRLDGVRSFLESRGISVPEGSAEDASNADSVHGLGKRKNETFHRLLETDGVEVFSDAREQIRSWKDRGLKMAVVSSSKNCVPILEAARMLDWFEAKVDGVDAQRLGLDGKPAPDIFLRGAEELGVDPSRAAVVEDAIAGVEAGKAGAFARVVGIARGDTAEALMDAGADVVVHDLRQLEAEETGTSLKSCAVEPCSALLLSEEIARKVAEHGLALFLDYDGTLTPIVRHPSEAVLSDRMRARVRELAERTTVSIVSGRDRADVEGMAQIEGIVYAGSHGFDIRGPDIEREHEAASGALSDLEEVQKQIAERIEGIEGAWIERKRFAVTVHYREVAEAQVGRVTRAIEEVAKRHQDLRRMDGKKIYELLPDVEWGKGRAVRWLQEALGVDPEHTVSIYIGDDTTDEEAFEALREFSLGIGVRVGLPLASTKARYFLPDCRAVERFLEILVEAIPQRGRTDAG